MAVFNGYNTGYNAYANPYYYGYNPQQQMMQQQMAQQQVQPQYNPEQLYYVHGIAGANAFQLPNGVNRVTLWDEDKNCFYVKGYDNNGVPRILAWNDYTPHVEETQQETSQVDMTKYATKDDIKEMLSSFMTKQDFDKAVKELSVGERGRIVRTNESNA